MQRRRSDEARKYLVMNLVELSSETVTEKYHQASLRNDSLLQSTIQRIQNDTQSDTPNNKSAKGLSPQNSLRGRSNTSSSVQQVSIKHGIGSSNLIGIRHASSRRTTSYGGLFGACFHSIHNYNLRVLSPFLIFDLQNNNVCMSVYSNRY